MASSVTVDVDQAIVPKGQLLYNLITKNNLHEIRSLLDPLTLRTRQSIVCQKVYKKTLLGYACELRFRDIAKYLLDECEADISERYKSRYTWLSPLRVSINNLDITTFNSLLQRGAVAADVYAAIRCVQFVSKKNYFFIVSILRKYVDEIKSIEFADDLPDLFAYLDDMSLNDVNPFLSAVAAGNIDKMKIYLPNCIDPKATNNFDENALCIAILNEQDNAVYFLLNYKIFSLKDYVRALEICGAKLIAFELRVEKGLQCWKKALRIRTEHSFGVSDKFGNKLQADLGSEFTCEEQLDAIENNSAELYSQALLIFHRLLSPTSQILANTFVMVAKHPDTQKDFVRTINVLCELVELHFFPHFGSISPSSMAIDTFEKLLCTHLECDISNKDELLTKFQNLVSFMKKIDWKLLLRRQNPFPFVVYTRLLKHVLYFLTTLSEFELTAIDKKLQRDGISEVMKWHSNPYPTTLLHLSIEDTVEYSVICLIIDCSDNVNCIDNQGNTPMHAAASLPADYPYLLRLASLLRFSGGNIDALNQFGMSPYMMLQQKGAL